MSCFLFLLCFEVELKASINNENLIKTPQISDVRSFTVFGKQG